MFVFVGTCLGNLQAALEMLNGGHQLIIEVIWSGHQRCSVLLDSLLALNKVKDETQWLGVLSPHCILDCIAFMEIQLKEMGVYKRIYLLH